jgi:hypothetical protein
MTPEVSAMNNKKKMIGPHLKLLCFKEHQESEKVAHRV